MRNLLLVSLLILMIGCKKHDSKPSGKSGDFKMFLLDDSTTPSKRQVNILFQVIDKSGIGVNDLKKEDLDVLENSDFISPESNLTLNTTLIPQEIKTILLLDISSSITPSIQVLKDAAISLIDSKLEVQKFAIYTFDKAVYQVQDFTADAALLKTKLNAIPSDNIENSTNLYGALIELTSNTLDWEEHYTLDQISIKNLILFTDGRHNANPSITIDQAVTSIGTKKVYVAALQSTDLREEPLKKIANQGYYLSGSIDKLKDKLAEVEGAIKKFAGSNYYLYYTSPISDPTSRNNGLEIRIRNNTNSSTYSKIQTSFNSSGFD